MKASPQLSVATRTRDLSAKSQRIRLCLKAHPEGYSPKLIALETGLNVNTVKTILPRMKDVKRPIRGIYTVVNEGDGPSVVKELSDWNFHNAVLTYVLNDFSGELVEEVHNLGLVRVEFVISTVGKASCRLASDTPLNVPSLGLLSGYFIELLRHHSSDAVDSGQVRVSTVEFNKDYSNLRLDGMRAATVDSLSEQFKAYQKALGLRLERKPKGSFQVADLAELLVQKPHAPPEELVRLTRATEANTQMLYLLIDKIQARMPLQ